MSAEIAFSPSQMPLSSALWDSGGTLGQSGKPSLRSAVSDLETMFLSQLLKQLRENDDKDGGLFAGDSGDVYGGLFDFYLGKHLADAGGIGLASVWMKQLEPTLNPEQPHDASGTNGLGRPNPGMPRSNSP